MRPLAVIVGLLIALNSVLLTELALYSRNTFAHHPEWFLGKMLMQRQPISIYDCIRTRNLTARNRLNLAAWHGMQEALVNRVVRLERARLRYRLQDRAYLVVIVNLTPDGMTGLRLSRFPQMPSVFFRADPGGRFLEQQPLQAPTDGGWHRLEVTPERVRVDDGPAQSWKAPAGPGLFGFRGSFAPVEVDDVELWEDGRLTLQDDFRNDRQAGPVGLHCLGLILVVTGLAYLAGGHDKKRALMWIVLGQFMFLMLQGLFFLVDYTVWSERYAELEPPEKARLALAATLDGIDPAGFGYPHPEVLEFAHSRQPPKSLYRLQVHRDGQTYRLPDTAEAIRAYRREHPRTGRCVVVLGASQAWGEGVVKLEDAMLDQLHRYLKAEVVNAALQGSASGDLVRRYLSHLKLFQPQQVVAYLGSNDTDPGQLSANLRRLVTVNRREGAETLVVLEANSPENPNPDFPPHLERKHAAMRETVARLQLRSLDLHARLSRPEVVQSGLLWWDAVHPTSYGHILAGQALAGELFR